MQIGTGTQSAVMIGMLELCLRHRTSSGLRLFVVEEPELFLHPHSQRHVASLLRRIAAENSSYIIVTTHSPAILADNDIRDVIRVGRDAAGTRCRRLPPDYSELDKSEQILTTQTCEMFFAERATLTEGLSEAIVLPAMAPLTRTADGKGDCDFDRLNISIIDVGGKDHIRSYSKILEAFLIDTRVITDRDTLSGDTLKVFRARAGLVGSELEGQQIDKLRSVGVAVLK